VGLGAPAYDIVKKPTPTRRYELWFLSKLDAATLRRTVLLTYLEGRRPAFAGMTVEGTPRGFDTATLRVACSTAWLRGLLAELHLLDRGVDGRQLRRPWSALTISTPTDVQCTLIG